MARRDDYEHWSMGLQEKSEALADVDAICDLTGLQRGEVCRLIVITWSKACHGKVQELWGFTPGVVFAGGGNGQTSTPAHQDGQTPESKKRKKLVNETTAAAVQGLNLDLE
jgi:hypothetical protein